MNIIPRWVVGQAGEVIALDRGRNVRTSVTNEQNIAEGTSAIQPNNLTELNHYHQTKRASFDGSLLVLISLVLQAKKASFRYLLLRIDLNRLMRPA